MKTIFKSGRSFRYLFIAAAIVIAVASVWVTNVLVDKLKEEERKKIETLAEAIALNLRSTAEDSDAFSDFNQFLLKITEGNTTIPVIISDDLGEILDYRNFNTPESNSDEFLKKKIKDFAKKHERIAAKIDSDFSVYLYYDDSTILKQLQLFPFVQMSVVFIFIVISFLALNSARRAEQNRIWVGLSKETAHQLGTPISSLMAWVEYLKTKDIDEKLLTEMDKDVQRLKTIAERFSKIGSSAEAEPMDLALAVRNSVEYMQKRISTKVTIKTEYPPEQVKVLMNESLFSWIIENLIKNAVDAMDGRGKIGIVMQIKGNKAIIDVSDTGKGIAKSKFDAVFQPGYTTKQRGWGLGLSLVKRIIEFYQKGKIFVYKSELNKGTTFRIELKTV
jgi:nitrogen-specific signal transduction histidine kinase